VYCAHKKPLYMPYYNRVTVLTRNIVVYCCYFLNYNVSMRPNTSKTDDEIYYQNITSLLQGLYFQRVICGRNNIEDLAIHAYRCLHQTDFSSSNDCWIWSGPVFVRKRLRTEDKKQPRINIIDPTTKKRKDLYARRFAYEQIIAPLEGDWLGAYRCDEDLCINPGHATKIDKSSWVNQPLKEMLKRVEARSQSR
jgi:hypothetical protein